jgi:hypothetical protein
MAQYFDRTPVASWLGKLCRQYRVEQYALGYQPETGRWSAKAERLVDFCLGEFSQRPIAPFRHDFGYCRKLGLLQLETDAAGRELILRSPAGLSDQKKVILALTSQRARIPASLRCWLVVGDSAGRATRPEQGLHLSGMRSAMHRHLVLVPTSNRERFLGPRLHRQMQELRESWVPWEDKIDAAWWGGALSGDQWSRIEPRTLTRREVLYHFRDHPSDRVSLNPTTSHRDRTPEGVNLVSPFTKKSAFRHKCLVLLPGNDIASGSSWYFASNSVVLMPKPHLEHILYFEMNPWEHYVPLVKLSWVVDHPQEARSIIANSHERLRWLCGPEYQWACNEVLRRVTQASPDNAPPRR